MNALGETIFRCHSVAVSNDAEVFMNNINNTRSNERLRVIDLFIHVEYNHFPQH